jgi:hypothetical protein
MQRFLAALAIVAVAAFVYTTAAPGGMQAGPTAAQFAAVKKQVAALQRTTKQLKRANVLLLNEIEINYEGDACVVGLTADELQNTWLQIDQLAAKVGQPAIFGAQTALNDRNGCEGLGQPNVPRMPIDPAQIPSVTPYFTLINWLHG